MRFLPNNFTLRPEDREWAKDQYRIDDKEVERQLELLSDHEFRRSYTDWNRVFRNWIRKADQIGSLLRERVYSTTLHEPTDEDRRSTQEAFQKDLERLGVNLKVVK